LKIHGDYVSVMIAAVEAGRIPDKPTSTNSEEVKQEEESLEYQPKQKTFHKYANERLQNFAQRFNAHALKMIKGPKTKRKSSKSS